MATELVFNIERESPAIGSLWLTARGVKDETLFTVSVNHVSVDEKPLRYRPRVTLVETRPIMMKDVDPCLIPVHSTDSACRYGRVTEVCGLIYCGGLISTRSSLATEPVAADGRSHSPTDLQ